MAEAVHEGGTAPVAHAFTQGMDGPALAAHHRKRKVNRLKDAPVRGRNSQARKTKEPAVAPEVRVAAYPGQGLRVDGAGLFCDPCGKTRSMRSSSLKTHMVSTEHVRKLELWRLAQIDDDDISSLITQFFEDHPDARWRHHCRTTRTCTAGM